MSYSKFTYSIMSASLEETLHLISEMENITGMEPESITLESGEKIRYNKADSKKLYRGGISEEEYISRNLMPDLIE